MKLTGLSFHFLIMVLIIFFCYEWYYLYSIHTNEINQKNVLLQNKCPTRTILTVIPSGNTANQVFEYLSVIAINNLFSHKQFLAYVPQSMKNKLNSFNFDSLSTNISEECIKNCKHQILLRKNESVQTLENIPYNTCKIVLDEYSARFEEILKYGMKNIKNYFTFKNEDVIKAQTTLETIRSSFLIPKNSTITYVGVHYRGGDYLNFLGHFTSKVSSTYQYYSKAMNYFTKVYKFVIFILISEDHKWILSNRYHWSGNIIVLPNKDSKNKIDDLTLLSQCNHTIINYGTFGVYPALYNGGTTIAYDLEIPIDHRGPTIAMGIAGLLDNWILINLIRC